MPSSATLPYLAAPSPNKRHTKSNAQVAQLVEQLAFNQLVLGSNPSLRTFPHPHRQSSGAFLFPPAQTERQQAEMRTLERSPDMSGRSETGFDCRFRSWRKFSSPAKRTWQGRSGTRSQSQPSPHNRRTLFERPIRREKERNHGMHGLHRMAKVSNIPIHFSLNYQLSRSQTGSPNSFSKAYNSAPSQNSPTRNTAPSTTLPLYSRGKTQSSSPQSPPTSR